MLQSVQTPGSVCSVNIAHLVHGPSANAPYLLFISSGQYLYTTSVDLITVQEQFTKEPQCFGAQVPSEKLQRAGKVLRNAILSRAPHMIRDRKYHLKTYR